MRRALLLAASLFLLAGLAQLPAAAQARTWTASCLPGGGGPTCHWWDAKVVSINDGDTIGVKVNGHGRVHQVRFIGVQAMELHKYGNYSRWAGECHAVPAARRVLQLMRATHWRVRLSAQHPNKRFTYRIGRWIAVKVNGRWQDLGAIEMAEGLTLWMSDETDPAWNDRYNLLGQQAAQRHIGMWNPTACGAGPSQSVPLRMWVNWDPPGVDQLDPNGEWMKVQNMSQTQSVSLGRWWVRDSMDRRFTFPRGTVLTPGATVTVHVGRGQRSPGVFYWGIDNQIFQNIGDGGYLFDPHGDLRDYMVYPCVVACSDPNQGALRLQVQTRAPQYVRLQNVSNHAVDLYGYILMKQGRPYDFGAGSVLQPGQTMQVDVEGDASQDTQFERHWGMDHPILSRQGDAVKLETFNSITVACSAWGYASC
jgi:endonuclease YncB( thermonuclease family)